MLSVKIQLVARLTMLADNECMKGVPTAVSPIFAILESFTRHHFSGICNIERTSLRATTVARARALLALAVGLADWIDLMANKLE